MNTTTNYTLPQWKKTDPIQLKDFNDAFGRIDAQMKKNADAAGGKADGAATSAALAALAKNLGTGGQNCRIAWGSYTGSGKYGSANPNTLNFDFKPMIVFISTDNYGNMGRSYFMRPMAYGWDMAGQIQSVTWGEHSLSWYFPGSTNGHVWQNNTDGYVYHYVAIGY